MGAASARAGLAQSASHVSRLAAANLKNALITQPNLLPRTMRLTKDASLPLTFWNDTFRIKGAISFSENKTGRCWLSFKISSMVMTS